MIQGTVRNGRRCSTAKAFLRIARDRPNLHLSIDSYATKIRLDSTNTAIGVEFVRNGHMYSISVTQKVIVSAGVINSPQLLMLSGIGPRKHLDEFGISVIADLPVGEN